MFAQDFWNLWGLADSIWFWVIGVALFVGLIVLFFIIRSRQSKED
jgi:heme/copper-type cytochrome/quinol oxidase subunit 2